MADWSPNVIQPQYGSDSSARLGMANIMGTDAAAKEQFPYAITVQQQQASDAVSISDAVPRLPDYAKPGKYNTDLGAPDAELKFQQWVKQNNIPFDPAAPVSDYDMRGFYQALQAGDPKAKEAFNANDGQMHFPDYWKTPYHESFSNESQWADTSKAPKWNDKDQLVTPDGKVVFDERDKATEKMASKNEENKSLLGDLKDLLAKHGPSVAKLLEQWKQNSSMQPLNDSLFGQRGQQ